MIHHLLVSGVAVAGLMLAWIAVQGLKRRTDPDLHHGDDVLACATCGRESCLGCRGLRSSAAGATVFRVGGIETGPPLARRPAGWRDDRTHAGNQTSKGGRR
jgi:hypothetical protein